MKLNKQYELMFAKRSNNFIQINSPRFDSQFYLQLHAILGNLLSNQIYSQLRETNLQVWFQFYKSKLEEEL